MASNVDFERCDSKYIRIVTYNDLRKNYRSITHSVLDFTLKKVIPNGLQLCFMDINVYLDVIYGVYYLFIYSLFWIFIEFSGNISTGTKSEETTTKSYGTYSNRWKTSNNHKILIKNHIYRNLFWKKK
eukprot:87844_1